jgi:hypothetical protein
MTTKILDTEIIYESPPLREWAAAAVERYRSGQRLEAVTIREGSGGQSWLPEDVRWLWQQEVMRPAVGELQRRLYGGQL